MKSRLLPLLALLLSACQPATKPELWSGYAEGEYLYLGSPLAGRVSELKVQAGAEVQAGQALFAQEDALERQARGEAEARLEGARAQAANLQTGRRPDERAVTAAQLAQAREAAAQSRAALQREQALVQQGFVSAARLDDLRHAAAQGADRVRELEAALRVAALPGRGEEQRAAGANAQAAQAQLAQQQWREGQRVQTAPAPGRISELLLRPGEWANAGQPVLVLLPRGGTKARFFVPEAELGRLKPGQAVRLRCDGCGEPIAARIERIATGPEFTPPVIYSNAQRARLVFMVEARPEPADGLRLKPGQPLDVELAK